MCDLWVMTLSAFLIKLCLIVIPKDLLQFIFVVYSEVMLLSFLFSHPLFRGYLKKNKKLNGGWWRLDSVCKHIKIGNGPKQSSITPSEMEFQISKHSRCNKCSPNDGIVKDQTNDEGAVSAFDHTPLCSFHLSVSTKKIHSIHDWSQ